jgi:hypothetical protein
MTPNLKSRLDQVDRGVGDLIICFSMGLVCSLCFFLLGVLAVCKEED